MPLNPFTLKQMKDGTLTTLRLQGQPLDDKDYRILSNYLRTTQTLRELDCTYMNGSIDLIAEALKQNRSVVKLGLMQAVADHNVGTLVDIIKENPTIAELNLSNCYMQGGGIGQIARAIKAHPHITHLNMEGVNRDHMTGECKLDVVTRTLKDNPNILSFQPETDETERICAANEAAARRLLDAALKAPETMSAADLGDVTRRLPAMLSIAEKEAVTTKKELVQMLVNVEDAAQKAGVSFAVPERFSAIAAETPRPFAPAEDKVDFAALDLAQLRKPTAVKTLYKAAEAGQVEELMGFMKDNGLRLTSTDCVFKPEGKRENFIELVARQGKLSAVMNAAVWTGAPRDLKVAAEAVPQREWKRQLKDMPLERLIFETNAASFKQARKPKPATGPGLG